MTIWLCMRMSWQGVVWYMFSHMLKIVKVEYIPNNSIHLNESTENIYTSKSTNSICLYDGIPRDRKFNFPYSVLTLISNSKSSIKTYIAIAWNEKVENKGNY